MMLMIFTSERFVLAELKAGNSPEEVAAETGFSDAFYPSLLPSRI
jgi:hypothetical protein